MENKQPKPWTKPAIKSTLSIQETLGGPLAGSDMMAAQNAGMGMGMGGGS